jgi:hypothetical protein
MLHSETGRRSRDNYIGGNSQEWVLLVGTFVPKTKSDTVPSIRVETVDGDLVGIFKTQRQAAKALNINHNHISDFLRKKIKNRSKGYIFKKIPPAIIN